MKKSIILTLLVLCICFSYSTFAPAQDNVHVIIDDESYSFDPPPIIAEGRTLIPMRAFFEALGGEVAWEETTRTAIGTREDIEIRIPIGSTNPTVNGVLTYSHD